MVENHTSRVTEALEEYLEAIYTLSVKKKSVRITDIALNLGISKPSVNRAVNALRRAGLVYHEPYGDIVLTERGAAYGSRVHARHTQIKRFLINVLQISPEEADKEACLIEHDLSQNTIDKMVSFMEE